MWDVGWVEPFPGDDKKGGTRDAGDLALPVSMGDLVYAKSRYTPKYSPYVVYMPKKEIMFKM